MIRVDEYLSKQVWPREEKAAIKLQPGDKVKVVTSECCPGLGVEAYSNMHLPTTLLSHESGVEKVDRQWFRTEEEITAVPGMRLLVKPFGQYELFGGGPKTKLYVVE